MEDVIRVLSTLALKGAVAAACRAHIRPRRGTRHRCRFRADAGAAEAPARGRDGRCRRSSPARGWTSSRRRRAWSPTSMVDLARSYVGIAVKAGAPHPDISTEAALRATLLGARRSPIRSIGASGILFRRADRSGWGIAAEINARAIIIRRASPPSGCHGRGRSRRPADQRTEAGRGHRGGRPDPARTADAGRVLRRPHGGIGDRPQRPIGCCDIWLRPKSAPVLRECRARALNLPARRRNLACHA